MLYSYDLSLHYRPDGVKSLSRPSTLDGDGGGPIPLIVAARLAGVVTRYNNLALRATNAAECLLGHGEAATDEHVTGEQEAGGSGDGVHFVVVHRNSLTRRGDKAQAPSPRISYAEIV